MGCNSSQAVVVQKAPRTIPNEANGDLTEKDVSIHTPLRIGQL